MRKPDECDPCHCIIWLIPSTGNHCLTLIHWRKYFKLTLIHWAATLNDPFGTNFIIEDVVMEVWKVVFPSITNEVDGFSHEAIIHVVRTYSIMSNFFSTIFEF